MKRIVAAVVITAWIVPAAPAWAGSHAQDSTLEQMGYGTGSVLGSAVYFPFKAAFCILGGIGSGVTLAVAGSASAKRVADASCRGTWAITPDIVRGREPVQFVGRAVAEPSAASGPRTERIPPGR